MCTLAIAFRQHAGVPLLVAANRDEALDRPASPPAIRMGAVRHLAPRDERAGGTWVGLNARGLFVGITNRAGVPPDHARASRGALVSRALEQPSAAALQQELAALDPTRFNPFHLLYADRAHAFITWTDGVRLSHLALEPGLHVVTERSFDAAENLREGRVRKAWAELAPASPLELEALRPVTTIHDEATRIGGTCVHAPEVNYGTRSSMLLALTQSGSGSRMLWAEGRPCVNPHVDQTPLLEQLALQGG